MDTPTTPKRLVEYTALLEKQKELYRQVEAAKESLSKDLGDDGKVLVAPDDVTIQMGTHTIIMPLKEARLLVTILTELLEE